MSCLLIIEKHFLKCILISRKFLFVMQSKQFKFLKFESNNKKSVSAYGRLEPTIPRIRDRRLCLLRYRPSLRRSSLVYYYLFVLHLRTGTLREPPLMTSRVFWSFLAYLPTLSYSITSYFWGNLGPPYLPLILDVIDGRSLIW